MRSSKNSYYIFRHGETFSTRDGVPYGEKKLDAEILPEGVPAIKRLAQYLKTVRSDINYTSELLRCLQTSQVITHIAGKEFEKWPLINEYTEDTFEDFQERMEKAVEELEKKTDTTYLLCTHGAVISALKHNLIYGEYEQEDLMDFPVPGTLMIINSSGSEILDFNS